MDAEHRATSPIESASAVPMFPLRGVFLFPGQILPLHIFEPRYRQMVEESLDRSGRLVIATQLEAERANRPPAVLPVAGLGEIARYERLPNDRFLLLLLGLTRVRITEADSDRPYRKAHCSPFTEQPVAEPESERLHRELTEAIQSRTGIDLEQTEDAGFAQLVDVLAQCLDMPTELMAAIYTETRLAQRALEVLAAHQRYPSRK